MINRTLLYWSKGIKNSTTTTCIRQYSSTSNSQSSVNNESNKKIIDKIDKVMTSVRRKYQINSIVELQSKIKQEVLDNSNNLDTKEKEEQEQEYNDEDINSEFENVLLSLNDISSTTTTNKTDQQQSTLIPNIVFENIEREFEKVMGSLDIKQKEPLIVGVSGGPDSMALCFLLKNYCRKYNLKLIAVTIDHQLTHHQDTKSEDIEFLKQTLKSMAVKSVIKTIDYQDGKPPNSALMKKLRDHRITILIDTAKQFQSQYLFYGSNKSDQIETLIHRIQRNSGLYGLSSMSNTVTVAQNSNHHHTHHPPKPIKLVRPLLSATKEDLLAFCIHNQVPYYVDPCNNNTSFSRNQTRTVINQSLSPSDKRYLLDGLSVGIDIFHSLKNHGEHFITRLCNEVILKSIHKQVPIIRIPFRYIEQLPEFLKIKLLYHLNCMLIGQFNFFQMNAYQQFLLNFFKNPTKPYVFQNIMLYIQDNDLIAQLSIPKSQNTQPITQHTFEFSGY